MTDEIVMIQRENITFYTENYPPANYLVNDELKGISVDTLRAMWKHLNISEQDIQIVPWSLGYRFTLDKNKFLKKGNIYPKLSPKLLFPKLGSSYDLSLIKFE